MRNTGASTALRRVIPVCVLVIFTFTVAASEEPLLALTVMVDGAEPNVGQILVSLFDSEETYLKKPIAMKANAVDADGRAVFAFAGLRPGEYAVTVMHDENSNGKLDTGCLRIPKEKIGFSNNAKGTLGPASYDKTRFQLTGSNTEITVTLASVKKNKKK